MPRLSLAESRGLLRPATRADVPAMQRVRGAVRENRLVSRVISDADVAEAIERSGRGRVVEVDSGVVAFAVGNAETGNIWALFVEPGHETGVTAGHCTTQWCSGFGRAASDACAF